MRYVLAFLAVLAATGQAWADPEAEARAALALARARVQPAADPPAVTVDVAEAECLRTGRPLYVWVGYACKSSEVRVDALHVHTAGPYRWPHRTVEGPAVAVVRRTDAGRLRLVAVVDANDVSANELRRAAAPPVALTAPQWQAPPALAPRVAWGSSGGS